MNTFNSFVELHTAQAACSTTSNIAAFFDSGQTLNASTAHVIENKYDEEGDNLIDVKNRIIQHIESIFVNSEEEQQYYEEHEATIKKIEQILRRMNKTAIKM